MRLGRPWRRIGLLGRRRLVTSSRWTSGAASPGGPAPREGPDVRIITGHRLVIAGRRVQQVLCTGAGAGVHVACCGVLSRAMSSRFAARPSYNRMLWMTGFG